MHIETLNNRKSKNENIFFDDFEIEDIPFKAITKGLGFSDTINDFKKPLINKSHVHNKNYKKIIKQTDIEISSVPAELEAFYGKKREVKIKSKIDLKNKIEKNAEIDQRLGAWLIDLFVITATFLLVTFTMFTSTSLNFDFFINFLSTDFNFIFPLSLFCLIYTIYNAIFGFRQTLGQKFLKIRPFLKSLKSDPITFLIKRTVMELLSVPLLGLPYLMKLDYKYLGNRIVRK